MAEAADGPRQARVLLVTKGLGLGGAEALLTAQVERRDASWLHYEAAYVRPDKTFFAPRLEAAGAPCHLVGGGRDWPLKLARLVREERFDLVHSHFPLPATVARVALAPGRGRTPHLYTEHNRWAVYRPATRRANQLTMGLDTWIWVVSDDARASMSPRLRARAETLVHGVDVAAIRRCAATGAERVGRRHELGIGATDLVFTNVANRRPQKAHDVLLEAFTEVAHQEPRARLVLVGQYLDDPGFQADVEATGVADRISVLGYRSDAAEVLGVSDVFLMSSDHEGLPVAVMEALAVGLPVVSTGVGGIPELVRDGVEGRLVPPRRPAELAAAALEMVDADRRAALGAAAGARAGEVDAARAISVIEARYRAVLGHAP